MEDEEYQLKEYVDGRGFGSAVPEDIDTDFDTQHPRAFRIKRGNPREILERWVLRNKEFLDDWYIGRYPEQQIREYRGGRLPVRQFIPKPGPNYGGYGFPDEPPPAIVVDNGVTTGDGAGPADPQPLRPPDDGVGPAGGAGPANPQPLRPPDDGAGPAGGAADGVYDESDSYLLELLSPEAAEQFAMKQPATKKRRGNNGSGPASPGGTGANSKSINFTRPGWNRFRFF
jgi:hypothetical protein